MRIGHTGPTARTYVTAPIPLSAADVLEGHINFPPTNKNSPAMRIFVRIR